jgi:hypothetical protein
VGTLEPEKNKSLIFRHLYLGALGAMLDLDLKKTIKLSLWSSTLSSRLQRNKEGRKERSKGILNFSFSLINLFHGLR